MAKNSIILNGLIETNFDYSEIESIIVSKEFAIKNSIFFHYITSAFGHFEIPIIITNENKRDYYIKLKDCTADIEFCEKCFKNNPDCWIENKRQALNKFLTRKD